MPQFIRSLIDGSINDFQLWFAKTPTAKRSARKKSNLDSSIEALAFEAAFVTPFLFEKLKEYKCKDIDTINIEGVHMDHEMMKKLIDALKHSCASLSVIRLVQTKIDDESVKILGEFLENDSSIQSLHLDHNLVSKDGLEILLPSLFACVNLKHLSFSENGLINDESKDILKRLCESSYIRTLDLSRTTISEQTRTYLNQLLANPPENRKTPIPSSVKNGKKSGYVN